MRIPIRQTVARSIERDYIQSQLLKPGQRLPSVRELEKKYGVSDTTILQALNILEEQSVIYKIQGSGSYVSDARVLKDRQRLIGLVGPHNASELFLLTHKGVDEVARRHGCQVVMADSESHYLCERECVKRLIEAGCVAIILNPLVRIREHSEVDYLRNEFLDVPIVLVDTAYPYQRRVQVIFDNYRAGYDMTRFLVGEGHRRIAFMDLETKQTELAHRSVQERFRGYCDALQGLGIEYRSEYRYVVYVLPDSDADRVQDENHIPTEEQIELLLKNWLKAKDRPTALIALEDYVAMSTMGIAHELGVSVPDDLQIAGFDNRRSGLYKPNFPTTNPDFQRAGQLAAELAFQRLDGLIEEPFVFVLPVPLKYRRDPGKAKKI